jgi:hypothetical protein
MYHHHDWVRVRLMNGFGDVDLVDPIFSKLEKRQRIHGENG